jgi:anti-anti-sigma regulatory factor
MSDDCDSNLLIGRVDAGYLIVVMGRGTRRESAAVRQVATESLGVGHHTVTIDLNGCDYLDSTFLGCLVHLHKLFGGQHPPRFLVAGSRDKVQKLLAPCRLDTLLDITHETPIIRDTLLSVPQRNLDQFEMAQHVMECHRLLADLGGRDAPAFSAVANQLAKELSEHRPT